MSGLGPFAPNTDLVIPIDVENVGGEGVSGLTASSFSKAVVEHRTGEADVPTPDVITLSDSEDADYELIELDATNSPGSYAVRIPDTDESDFANDTDNRQFRIVLHRSGAPRAYSEWVTIKDPTPFDNLVSALTQDGQTIDARVTSYTTAALAAAHAYGWAAAYQVVSVDGVNIVLNGDLEDDQFNGSAGEFVAMVVGGPGVGLSEKIADTNGTANSIALSAALPTPPTSASYIAIVRTKAGS